MVGVSLTLLRNLVVNEVEKSTGSAAGGPVVSLGEKRQVSAHKQKERDLQRWGN